MTKQDDLIAYLFDGQQRSDAALIRMDAVLSGDLLQWMGASSRFTTFVEMYRDKIRKKIRVTREPESILDLRSELEVAYGLLTDRRLAAAYEPYASEKRRGPDFAVTYRTSLVFNIEVARIRVEESEAEGDGLAEGGVPAQEINRAPNVERKAERILLDKLGQMQPGMPNLLVIYTGGDLARSIDLGRLMQAIKTRAEGKDPSFYAISRYNSPAAFYKDFLHLSGILLWSEHAAAHAAAHAARENAFTGRKEAVAAQPKAPATPAYLWVNKQARPGLPENVLRVVLLALQNAHDCIASALPSRASLA